MAKVKNDELAKINSHEFILKTDKLLSDYYSKMNTSWGVDYGIQNKPQTPYQKLVERSKGDGSKIYYSIAKDLSFEETAYRLDRIMSKGWIIFETIESAKDYYYELFENLMNEFFICAFNFKDVKIDEIAELDNDFNYRPITELNLIICEIDY